MASTKTKTELKTTDLIVKANKVTKSSESKSKAVGKAKIVEHDVNSIELVTRKDEVGMAVGRKDINYLKVKKLPNGTTELNPDNSSYQGPKFKNANGTLVTKNNNIETIGVVRRFDINLYINKVNELYNLAKNIKLEALSEYKNETLRLEAILEKELLLAEYEYVNDYNKAAQLKNVYRETTKEKQRFDDTLDNINNNAIKSRKEHKLWVESLNKQAKELQLSLTEKELVRRLKAENELELLEKYFKEKHEAMKKEIKIYSSGLAPLTKTHVVKEKIVPTVDNEVVERTINNKEVKVRDIKKLVSYRDILSEIDPNSISSTEHKQALLKFKTYLDDLDHVNNIKTKKDYAKKDVEIDNEIKKAAIQYTELSQFYVIDEDKYYELIQANKIVSDAKKEEFFVMVPAAMYAAEKPKKPGAKKTSDEIEKEKKIEALKLGDGLQVSVKETGLPKGVATANAYASLKDNTKTAVTKSTTTKTTTTKPSTTKTSTTKTVIKPTTAELKQASADQQFAEQAAYVRNLKDLEDYHFKAYKDNANTSDLPKFSVEEAYDNINKAYGKKNNTISKEVNKTTQKTTEENVVVHSPNETTREYARISQLLASLPSRPVILNEPEELKERKIALDTVIKSFKNVSVEDIAFSPEKETIIMKLKHIIKLNNEMNEQFRSNQEKGKLLDAKYRVTIERDNKMLMDSKTKEIQNAEQISALIDQRIKLLQEENAKKAIVKKENLEENLKVQYIKHEELAIRNQQIINKLEEMLRSGRREIAHKQIKLILRKIKSNESKGIFIPTDSIPYTNTVVRNPEDKINLAFTNEDNRIIANVINLENEAKRALGKKVIDIKADILNDSVPKNANKVVVLEKYKNKSNFDRPIYMESYAEAKYEKVEAEILKKIGLLFDEATDIYQIKIEHANKIIAEADAIKTKAYATQKISDERNLVTSNELKTNEEIFKAQQQLEDHQYRIERKQFLLDEKVRIAEQRVIDKQKAAEQRIKDAEQAKIDKANRASELAILKQKNQELKEQQARDKELLKAEKERAIEEAKIANEKAKAVIQANEKISDSRAKEIITTETKTQVKTERIVESNARPHTDLSLSKIKEEVKKEIDLVDQEEIFKLLATTEINAKKGAAKKTEASKAKTVTTTTKPKTKAITVAKKTKK